MKKLAPHLAAAVLFATSVPRTPVPAAPIGGGQYRMEHNAEMHNRPNLPPVLYHQERSTPKQARCPIAKAHAKEILG